MGPLTTGSYHSGGANIVLADGSVRFLSETTPFATREALATMAGGEVLTLEQLRRPVSPAVFARGGA